MSESERAIMEIETLINLPAEARRVLAELPPALQGLSGADLRQRARQSLTGEAEAAAAAEAETWRRCADPTGPEGPIERAPAALAVGCDAGGRWHPSLLPVGEVAILAGAGSGGKSTLAGQFAVAAAGAVGTATWANPFPPSDGGVDAGVRVRAARAVMVGYEDAAAEVAWRARRCARWMDSRGGRNGGAHAAALRDPDRLTVRELAFDEALFEAPPGEGRDVLPAPTSTWGRLWDRVREINAGLVVIDPAALAAPMPGYDAIPVGRFVAALRREARAADAAVLLVTHTSKAARRGRAAAAAAGDDPAAAVMGSVAWTDRVRGALSFGRTWDPDKGRWRDSWELDVIKANYCRPGVIGARFEGVTSEGGRPFAFEALPMEGEHEAEAEASTGLNEHGIAV